MLRYTICFYLLIYFGVKGLEDSYEPSKSLAQNLRSFYFVLYSTLLRLLRTGLLQTFLIRFRESHVNYLPSLPSR